MEAKNNKKKNGKYNVKKTWWKSVVLTNVSAYIFKFQMA